MMLVVKEDSLTKNIKQLSSNAFVKDCKKDAIIPFLDRKDVIFETKKHEHGLTDVWIC